MKSEIAIFMGLVIAVADIYWTYTSYFYVPWLVLGIVILAADIAWIALDLSLRQDAQRTLSQKNHTATEERMVRG
jgi:hypothetical protein